MLLSSLVMHFTEVRNNDNNDNNIIIRVTRRRNNYDIII